MSVANSEVGGPKFTKFLPDVESTSGVLMRPSTLPSCYPLWNASPKKEGVSPISADLAPKIGCRGTFFERSRNKYRIEHLQPYVYQPWKFGEDRCGMFWDLFAPSDRQKKADEDDEKERK